MTQTETVPLRVAATLAHAVPGVRLQLRTRDGASVEVARSTWPAERLIPACRFRDAVRRSQHAVAACLEAIDVVVADGEQCAGGIVRVAMGGRDVHVFGTTLDVPTCTALFSERGDPAQVVHLCRDDATEVTLVHIESAPRDRPHAHALIEDLLAVCVVEELVTA